MGKIFNLWKEKNRKKKCKFCANKINTINYKDTRILHYYVSDFGKITPARVTGACAKHQRMVTQAIKRARIMALMPFVAEKID